MRSSSLKWSIYPLIFSNFLQNSSIEFLRCWELMIFMPRYPVMFEFMIPFRLSVAPPLLKASTSFLWRNPYGWLPRLFMNFAISICYTRPLVLRYLFAITNFSSLNICFARPSIWSDNLYALFTAKTHRFAIKIPFSAYSFLTHV